ncbi:MAG TPA: tetratricopeptide repeat protein, partial [Caldithrix sp.]|nr:tetratricopeptide repeat protein [Caldithrix sp.]
MMKYFIILSMSICLIINCESSNRKIKLASFSSNQTNTSVTASSTIRISPQEQSSIAITYFSNETGDPALEWLKRGLSDMFVTELSQSPYLNIVSMTSLAELAEQANLSEKDIFKPAIAIDLAKRAKTDLLLSGKFYQVKDSMYIEVKLTDTHSQHYVRKEVVSGLGMEQLFAMVDNLSEKVRSNIRGDLKVVQSDPINLIEMTTSVEAFRCYSSALENREKFFHGKSEEWIEKAVKADTNFAAGYLLMAEIKFNLGKRDDAQKAVTAARRKIDKLSQAQKYKLELLELRFDYSREKHITKLKQAIEEFPSNVDFHLELGRIYREIGEFEEALEQFEIVKEFRPNQKTIYNDLAYIYALLQDYKTGLAYINTYKKMAPDEPNPFDSAGEILMFAGRLEEAIPQLKTALSIDPTFYHSAEKLGRIYTELGDYDNAFKYLKIAEQYAEIEKMAQVIKWRYVHAYWKSGQIENALQIIDEIEEDISHKIKLASTDIAHHRAFIYHSIGEKEKANLAYQKCFDAFAARFDSITHYYDIDRLAGILLLSDLNPQKVISFLTKLQNTIKDDKSQTLLNLTMGLMALRNEEAELAKKYLTKDQKLQIQLIAEDRNEKWNNVWKYIFIALTDKNSPIDAKAYSDEMIRLAEENNREDLLLIGKIISALHYQNDNNIEQAEEIFSELGIPKETKWQVSGPYFDKNSFSYDHTFQPELTGNNKQNWHFINDGIQDGYLDFNQNFSKSDWATAYAQTYVYVPEEHSVEIRIGSDESFKLWLNDNLVLSRYLESDIPFDDATVKVVLRPGYNKLMIKVINRIHEWGFLCRITDEHGNG